VRDLARRYHDVSARQAGDEANAVTVDELATADLLHVAAHMQPDDQHPWRSRLELGDREGRDGGYTATEVASLDLGARLVFLSSCGTATGRIMSGEGVLGMTAAVLATGVPAVVSTLWPVDDAATTVFSRRFYGALAKGETVASALREAQLALRDDPATAAPFFWAGFVLAGDGDVRAPLSARKPWAAWVAAGLGAAFVAGLGLWRWWRARPNCV
jgi:CHAT domain-containing protein